ncbi:MAG: hypothetical protein NVS4B2_26770 [Chloroflexota bacterium]
MIAPTRLAVNQGYANRGVFVRVSPEFSMGSVMKRYQGGMNSDLGGRFIPPEVIMLQAKKGGGTINEDAFNYSRGKFARGSIVYNNEDPVTHTYGRTLVSRRGF